MNHLLIFSSESFVSKQISKGGIIWYAITKTQFPFKGCLKFPLILKYKCHKMGWNVSEGDHDWYGQNICLFQSMVHECAGKSENNLFVETRSYSKTQMMMFLKITIPHIPYQYHTKVLIVTAMDNCHPCIIIHHVLQASLTENREHWYKQTVLRSHWTRVFLHMESLQRWVGRFCELWEAV